jgi:hypothetical protein
MSNKGILKRRRRSCNFYTMCLIRFFDNMHILLYSVRLFGCLSFPPSSTTTLYCLFFIRLRRTSWRRVVLAPRNIRQVRSSQCPPSSRSMPKRGTSSWKLPAWSATAAAARYGSNGRSIRMGRRDCWTRSGGVETSAGSPNCIVTTFCARLTESKGSRRAAQN